VALFVLNAATYVAYVLVLVAVVHEPPRLPAARGGYGLVLRDLPFVRLAATNTVLIAVGWGVSSWILPLYAKNELRISSQLIGLLLLANAMTVVSAQVPIAKLAEGRRRVTMMAAGGMIFAAAYMLVLSARDLGGVAYAALLFSAVAIAVGECFHTSVLMPLVADLAPPSLRGRYMASMGLSWWTGLALGPILGTQLLALSTALPFAASAVAAGAAAASMLALDSQLPEASRSTPRPESGEPQSGVSELLMDGGGG
jgi:predicted MFS family arabinose efflux permease